MSERLTHFDDAGRPNMVDVTDKHVSKRTATAMGSVIFSADVYNTIRDNGVEKGDIASVAELAGIIGAKRTADLIPLCHPLPISGVNISVVADDSAHAFVVTASVKTTGQTGVEMEALTAVSIACLTIYDMAKALDKGIVITNIALLEKTGGKSGDYSRK